MKERVRRRFDAALGLLGRTFITAGLLLLGLVVYQLWGTGLEQSRAQSRLRDEFATLIASPPTTADSSGDASNGIATRVDIPARPNSALALLEIPSASVADVVVNGATVSALRHGPGHIPGTALPGEPGNSAIAGHRTTYGAPFADLDDVAIGDDVIVTTRSGRFTYTVNEMKIVGPKRTDVLRPREGRTLLTLITCHPRWSTAKRLIVVAELSSSEPVTTTSAAATTIPQSTTSMPPPSAPTTVPSTPIDETTEPLAELDGWFSDTGAVLPAILLGLGLVAISVGTHFLRRDLRRRGRRDSRARMVAWSVSVVPFFVVLFYWYHFINMLLPAST
ncbi:MAG: class E sortase [Ilumatobacteraceae bacterium]